MSRGRNSGNKRLRIFFRDGDVSIVGRGLDIELKDKFYVLRLNPSLIIRGLRKGNKKIIYINGKKFGYCITKSACPPLPYFMDKRGGFSAFIGNFFRCVLGIFCVEGADSYMLVNMQGHEFILLPSRTEDNNLRCDAFFSKSGRQMASFVFDADFTKVIPYIERQSWLESVMVMAGYVAGMHIYSTVVESLNREIDIIC